MTADDIKLLDDNTAGLDIEKKDGRDVVKGGRLVKLIERLTHHQIIGIFYLVTTDFDFRNTFILTYYSFATPMILLDYLVKRYPYN